MNMGMLYAGKTSGVLVAVVFLPMYNRLLGTTQFGVVAVILSLQSLLFMMDFGMSSLIGRDFAIKQSQPHELLSMLRNAEFGLLIFYAVLFVFVLAMKLIGGMASVSMSIALVAVLFFCMMVMQNLYYCAMMACRYYSSASFLQIAGGLARAGVTAYTLSLLSASVYAFVVVQMILAAIHYLATRYYFSRLFIRSMEECLDVIRPSLSEAYALFKRGRSLALFALAGAAVMYLDKPIASAFMSAADVAPYFLATTLCLGSISVLATPISQFFQPKLLNAINEREFRPLKSKHVVIQFTYSLLIVTLLPSIILWVCRESIINLWMGAAVENNIIANYVAILLPGVAINFLGFVPYSLLISVKDFQFQSRMSMILTVITLGFAAVFSWLKTMDGVCYAYAIYNTASTLISWVRAMHLPAIKDLGRASFYIASTALVLLGLLGFFIRFIFLQ
jgi:O-antigen/teichoic acid export membrane protein